MNHSVGDFRITYITPTPSTPEINRTYVSIRQTRICSIHHVQYIVCAALNTQHIEELLEIIEEDRLALYKDVLAGKYDIRKGDEWKDDLTNHRLIVKNIEVFEKVVPIFLSLTKQYNVAQVREIFVFC